MKGEWEGCTSTIFVSPWHTKPLIKKLADKVELSQGLILCIIASQQFRHV